ncbi:fructose-bisphosphate aldolase [Candidatus Marsarchaeota G2 archaeon ECH_B_SAG-F08]|jgi:predicted phospho-2-dehydro-3-deoxyheptonate aldolase|uniref:2-amino-3,7-dideoxy-D-threo-hept-6-ulosonate synthase n=6 Tax=Candidatus Marsarchaeota TaxID=1978152 RepID=A0A2R6AG53_9ARCH|nr:MAG: fructose-bisphosphate aldolase [Candidatus Marsarchaeota G1 archaeon OSP_D]PSN85293.1 MAG: fructose-bisphosphate aldolase [Candidatus Marsarchaeota G1 archaeon BE_D]PSN87980.1 MAG: fructose-bisphosphate aldolase [Candidatus Marsarchaeota G1 archaeon OSP_C]PSN95089.1 MAG: fructose-bisphosphate aldolase [Candidatus Marsarchaeota G1 archaeon OSP_B]PSN97397.1 MAG: fructose-bisphosphate aldolase [Candidatus Marsarchaeota G2 archaeon ECH_B_SAG-F08]PSO04543.1 MAG: fructose-bisphosphate aldola
MTNGKSVRIARITRQGKMLCVPMDHGVTNGPISGLENPWLTISKVSKGGATAVLAHKGVFRNSPEPISIGTIMHVNANTTLGPAPNLKVLVASVKEAIRLGVDAVSIHINIGSDEEPSMLHDLGVLADECDEWGLPLIAMMYPRGPRIKSVDVETVAHVARVGAELGADIVKTVYPGSVEGFREVIKRCGVPVVLAGGPKMDSDLELLKLAESAMKAGAMGITFGRNIFGHKDPEKITRALSKVVFEGKSAEEAVTTLNE